MASFKFDFKGPDLDPGSYPWPVSIFHHGSVLYIRKSPGLSGLQLTLSYYCYVLSPAWHPVNLCKCFSRMCGHSKCPQAAKRKHFQSHGWPSFCSQAQALLRDESSPTSRTVRLGKFCQSGGCKWHLIIVLICISQITNENKQLFLCLFAIFSLCSEPIRLLAFLLLIWEVFFWNIYFPINPLLDKCIVNLNPGNGFSFLFSSCGLGQRSSSFNVVRVSHSRPSCFREDFDALWPL